MALSIRSGAAYVVPVYQYSCSALNSPNPVKDVRANSLSLRGIQIQNNSTNIAEIKLMKLTVHDPSIQGGSYSCTVGSKELESMSTSWASLKPGATALSECALRCGGFAVVDPARSFAARGDVKILGAMTDPAGNQQSSESTYPITIIYQGGF
ncbi:MAG: hypothetical protein EOP04_26280 [Proteobacteria bacterium]|nr:MAG: hypothetical protein EOP04_26280 [Pseudomonadota bacterium]